MSKGGGAKVYFVLYLAVVLELLIIIVERDEAEEHLHAKQKETMKIVESILSQLQAGAGTEGINTRPQDEITLPPEGVDVKEVLKIEMKSSRRYIVEVGVTNVASEMKAKEGESPKDYEERLSKLIELANVSELEYAVFQSDSDDPNNTPSFPTDQELVEKYGSLDKISVGESVTATDGNQWRMISLRKIEMEEDATKGSIMREAEAIKKGAFNPFHPTYKTGEVKGSTFLPKKDVPAGETEFFYSPDETMKAAKLTNPAGNTIDKRAFVVNFEPPKPSKQSGWFKLYFISKTNRILGVRKDVKADDIENDEVKVNIGTVQLKAKDLKKVMVELERKLGAFLGEATYENLKNGVLDIRKFDIGLNKAAGNVPESAEKLELMNNIRLYGYIVKLLTPGQSVNFSQNKGSIQFNIRVVRPEVDVAAPNIFPEDEYVAFDELSPSLKFSLSPYMPDKKPTVEIQDESGKLVETISEVKVKGTPEKNKKAEFVALSGRNLQGNQQYKAVFSYSTAPGKIAKEERQITVFKTRESDATESNKLEPSYGIPFTFVLKHRSAAKINQQALRYYLNTDVNPNNQYMTEVKNITFPENAKKVSARVAWYDVERGKEVDIFQNDYNIKLPKVASLGGLNSSNTKENITTSGVGISFNTTARVNAVSPGKYPEVEVTIQYQKGTMSKGNLSQFKNKTLNLTPNGDGLVNINFKDFISGNPDSESNTLRGDFKIILIVKSKHPTFSDVRSDQSTSTYVVKFNKNFDE